MKTLVVYYSRTGVTKKVAEILSVKLKADLEEIVDTQDRSGALGYLKAGRDATFKKLTKLVPIKRRLSDYDLVVVGTPVWAWTMSTPIKTFLTENKGKFNQVAFFCTMGGSGDDKTFLHMADVCGKKEKARLAMLTKEVVNEDVEEKINNFLEEIYGHGKISA